MDVGKTDPNLLDAVVRLVRLLDVPVEHKVLAPIITREIVFRLLAGRQGARLSHLLASGGNTRRISKAIGRENLDRLLRIEDIASELGMSVSGFHHHFKNVTSPGFAATLNFKKP
jgi:transcriptional regulator GlxA family with amidase domain